MFLWKSLRPEVVGAVFARLAGARDTPARRDYALNDPRRSRSETTESCVGPGEDGAPCRPDKPPGTDQGV